MPMYRIGKPGEDCAAHVNLGRRRGSPQCAMPAREGDDLGLGRKCARMSVALCDSPGCDKPICEYCRTKHVSKPDTDFCPDHAALAKLP